MTYELHIDFKYKTIDEIMDMVDEMIDKKVLEKELELMSRLLYYEGD
jgi:hypothetical protein